MGFEFAVPAERAQLFRQSPLADLPLEFDDGSSPLATRITIGTAQVLDEQQSQSQSSQNANDEEDENDDDDDDDDSVDENTSGHIAMASAAAAARVLVHIGVGIQMGSELITFTSSAQ